MSASISLPTTTPDQQSVAQAVAEYTLAVAMDYMALGLDTEKTVFWRQSDMPEVTELTWLLSCITPMAAAEMRQLQGQDRPGSEPNHGLFAYPVLQAAIS